MLTLPAIHQRIRVRDAVEGGIDDQLSTSKGSGGSSGWVEGRCGGPAVFGSGRGGHATGGWRQSRTAPSATGILIRSPKGPVERGPEDRVMRKPRPGSSLLPGRIRDATGDEDHHEHGE